MAETRVPAARPLSPHLGIYRLTLTMVMSGLHRITGLFLYLGGIFLAWWLVAVASGPNAYGFVQWFIGTWIGKLFLLGYTWTLIHHTLGGVRHLIWDTGRGLEPGEREWLAGATMVGSVALTALIWAAGYFFIG